MLGAHYSEECMDELLEQIDKFLETHSITTLLEIVAVSIERKAEHGRD